MEDCAGHCHHISHGNRDMDSTEGWVNPEVVWAVLERPGIVSADLITNSSSTLQHVLLYYKSQKRRGQVQPNQQLQEESDGHATNLNRNFCVPSVSWVMFNEDQKRDEAETGVDRKIPWEQDSLHLAERVPW